MIDLRARVRDPATWLVSPALLVGIAGLAFVRVGLHDWSTAPDDLLSLFVATAETVAGTVVAVAYLDAMIAVLRHRTGVLTWIRVTCELFVAVPLVWVILGAFANERWSTPIEWAGYAGLYLIGPGWISVVLARRRRRADAKAGA